MFIENTIREVSKMSVITVTKDNFKDFIHNEGLIIIDFWASWCGPCRMLSPVLDELSRKEEQLIGKVNVDNEEDLVKAFSIHSIPTLLAFKDGKPLGRAEGFMPYDELAKWVEGLKK